MNCWHEKNGGERRRRRRRRRNNSVSQEWIYGSVFENGGTVSDQCVEIGKLLIRFLWDNWE